MTLSLRAPPPPVSHMCILSARFPLVPNGSVSTPPGQTLLWVDFLALLFRAFGAPGHIRVSYGSLPEEECLPAIRNLADGLVALASEAEATAST